jgi:RNA polymerase sigma-70 factor (ECF subfamily)
MRKIPTLHCDDLDLARRAARGERGAFREIFDFAFPRLFRFALSRCGSEELAEEVVQVTLCDALERLGSYRGEAALLTWMTTICRRQLLARRARAGRAPVMQGEMAQAVLESLPGDLEDAVARLEREELVEAVHRVLDWLPASYSQVLCWKYFDEISVAEIARRLGVGLKAAESRLTRARLAFRRELMALAQAGEVTP